MPKIIDITGKMMDKDMPWIESGKELLDAMPDEDADNIIKFVLSYILAECKVALGLAEVPDEKEEDLEPLFFRDINEMYHQAASKCTKCPVCGQVYYKSLRR